MKFTTLMILIALTLCCASGYSQTIEAIDSNHTSFDVPALKLVLNALIERDSYYNQLKKTNEENSILTEEVKILNTKYSFAEKRIELYQAQIEATKQPWYDRFAWGAIAVAVAVITGALIFSP